MPETKRQYAANYRKPPLHSRFKQGQSGNPRGRPKKKPAGAAGRRAQRAGIGHD